MKTLGWLAARLTDGNPYSVNQIGFDCGTQSVTGAVTADGLAVDLRTDGLGTVIREMLSPTREEAVA
jgi:hypothetical protein